MQSLFLTNWPQWDLHVYGPQTILKITRKEKKKISHNKKNQFSKTGLIRSNCEHAKQLVSKVAQTHVANFGLNAWGNCGLQKLQTKFSIIKSRIKSSLVRSV